MAFSQTTPVMTAKQLLTKLPAIEAARLLPALHQASLREEGLLPVLTLITKAGMRHHGRLLDYRENRQAPQVVLRQIDGQRETEHLVYLAVADVESVQVHHGEELLPELSGGQYGAYQGRVISKLEVARKLRQFAQDLADHRQLPVQWTLAADPAWERMGYDLVLSHAASFNYALRRMTLDAFVRQTLASQIKTIELRHGPLRVQREGTALLCFINEQTTFREELIPLIEAQF